MNKTRVIPVILLKNGRIVQSKNFNRHQVLGTPTVIVGRLTNWFADELIFLDISRQKTYDLKRNDLNFNNPNNIISILKDISKKCFMPLNIGGGIKTIKDIENRLSAGADKVTINSQALKNKNFIEEAVKKFGSQCIVASLDSKKVYEKKWVTYIECGKVEYGDTIENAKILEQLGVGEILINSIDRDGKGEGMDNELNLQVVNSLNIPVVCMGGVGRWNDFAKCIDKCNPSGVAAANIFQYSENSVYKAHKYLFENNYNVRKFDIETIIKTGDE